MFGLLYSDEFRVCSCSEWFARPQSSGFVRGMRTRLFINKVKSDFHAVAPILYILSGKIRRKNGIIYMAASVASRGPKN